MEFESEQELSRPPLQVHQGIGLLQSQPRHHLVLQLARPRDAVAIDV